MEEFFKTDGIAYENGKHFATEKNFFQYSNLNYGILGTVIEKVSGERFDKFIKKNILEPMNIHADYVVGNLSKKNFENLGTLYNQENGKWFATKDNFSEQPKKDFADIWTKYVDEEKFQSLENYKIGTNATVFNPAGSLRISFEELGNCLEMIMNGGTFRGKKIISKNSVDEMCKKQWIFDENLKNGDTYEVMFSYGLGLYQIDGKSPARLCKNFDIDLIGHSGEAYGMISGLYFTPKTKNGVIFMINGVGVEPGVDEKSFGKFGNGFIWEEEIMNPILENIFAK
ncbi:MAG: serine hydrolase [Selenomonadaceae bacterium]|nr:serine hydrolase [Selenomonadaceae bacterium]